MKRDGSVLIFDFFFFFKYLMRPMEDNVKRRPYRRRRFIICRRKNLFITPRPLVCTVSIWCKFPMWIAWHARYNGLNDSGDIKRRRYSIFFFYSFVTLQNVQDTRVYRHVFRAPSSSSFEVLPLLNQFWTTVKKK